MDEAPGLLLQEEGGGRDHEPLLLPLPQVKSQLTISLWFKFHPAVYRNQSVRFRVFLSGPAILFLSLFNENSCLRNPSLESKSKLVRQFRVLQFLCMN